MALIIFEWWAFIFFLGLIFFYFSSFLFSNFFDKGYLFSKIIGLLVSSYLVFVFGSLHVLSFGAFSITLVLIICGLAFFLLPKIYFKKATFPKISIKLLLAEELFFIGSFLFWIFIRSHNPDIHGIEKFMDYGILNSILRSEYFPAKDIWLSPFSINYYYYGHFVTGFIAKFLGTPPQLAFNIMLSLIFAFILTSSFSIGANLVFFLKKGYKKILLGGILSAFLVTLSGNLQTIYSFFKSYGENPVPFWNLAFQPDLFPNGYWYPSATRFISYTIHEFPSYALSLSDLHAHLLGTPFAILGLALIISVFLRKGEKLSKYFFLIPITFGFVLSVMYMTNSLDLAIYLFLGIIAFFFLLFKKGLFNLKKYLTYISLVLFSFFVFSLPFSLNFKPFVSGIGLLCPPEFLINIKSIGPILFEEAHCQRSPLYQLGILYGLFFFWLTSLTVFLYKKKRLLTDNLALIMFGSCILLIIFPELFYFKDIYPLHFRANTMFKMSYQVFIILSIFSSYAIIRIFSGVNIRSGKIYKKLTLIPLGIVAFLLFVLVSIYPYFSINSSHNNLSKVIGLDGTAYMKDSYPDDYQAINWINNNIAGQPVILEAQGDPYSDYARVSSNTGLPTLVGWPAHEWLWRGSYDIPGKRVEIVKSLYETKDTDYALAQIKEFDIRYVYIGGLEREKYIVDETKFLKLGKVIFKNPSVTIYKLN